MDRPKNILIFSLLLTILAAFLFSGYALAASSNEQIRSIGKAIELLCRDGFIQWAVIVCLAVNIAVFLLFEQKWFRKPADVKFDSCGARTTPAHDFSRIKGKKILGFFKYFDRAFANPNTWLGTFVLLLTLRYAIECLSNGLGPLQVLLLLVGIAYGKLFAIWASWDAQKQMVAHSRVTSDSKSNHRFDSWRHFTICSLMLLLAVTSQWQPERIKEFVYRGERRWMGLWENPNQYGMLMGVGLVLAVGIFVLRAIKASANIKFSTRNFLVSALTNYSLTFLSAMAAWLCLHGLANSYSRGAWLGTVVALAFMFYQILKRHTLNNAWFWRNRRQVILLLFSVFIICFFQFRHTESRLLRRVFSVGNIDDFSWRNRATVWNGMVQMIVDKPFFGFGWESAKNTYAQDYRAARLDETAAIQMNDFLLLGISSGMLATVCLLGYLGLVFLQRNASDLALICSAGAIVLGIGFFFNGGLFKLPTMAVFWLLLELARCPNQDPASQSNLSNSKSHGPLINRNDKFEKCFRWSVIGLAIVAIGLGVLHILTPKLVTGKYTLAIARNFLIPSNEKREVDFLVSKTIWNQEPLHTLLEHAHLANYTQHLINWRIEEPLYLEFVLSPQIAPDRDDDLNWRRALWEFFYPRVRKLTSIEAAAGIVFRQLSWRVKLNANRPKSLILQNWLQGEANEQDFQILLVAALRSVGIPSRWSAMGKVEFWDGQEWKMVSTVSTKESRASVDTVTCIAKSP